MQTRRKEPGASLLPSKDNHDLSLLPRRAPLAGCHLPLSDQTQTSPAHRRLGSVTMAQPHREYILEVFADQTFVKDIVKGRTTTPRVLSANANGSMCITDLTSLAEQASSIPSSSTDTSLQSAPRSILLLPPRRIPPLTQLSHCLYRYRPSSTRQKSQQPSTRTQLCWCRSLLLRPLATSHQADQEVR